MSTVLKNLSGKENFKTIPAIRFDLLNGENSFLVNTNFIRETLTVFKNHFLYQFKILKYLSIENTF